MGRCRRIPSFLMNASATCGVGVLEAMAMGIPFCLSDEEKCFSNVVILIKVILALLQRSTLSDTCVHSCAGLLKYDAPAGIEDRPRVLV